MTPWQAAMLGAVEGFTEFLPISSTGHLILAAHWLRLEGEAVKTFEVVIQSGALLAVAGLYRARVLAMLRGLVDRDPAGRRLLVRLLISFMPAAVVGVAAHRVIKQQLFAVWPVVAALAAGGVLMLAVDRWVARPHTNTLVWGARRRPAGTLESLTVGQALVIGLAQCLALWPGTSRAMTTIVAGLLLGLPATAAAEYSFLLALPTLGAATVFDLVQGGGVLMQEVGPASVASGFIVAAVVAALAIYGFIQYLTRHGLAVFGWYRIALGGLVWWLAR